MKRTFRRKLKSTRTEYDGLLGYTEIRLTPAEISELDKAPDTTLADNIASIREWAAETLRKAGIPYPADDLPLLRAVKGREMSVEWQAVQLLQRADSLERAIARGDMDWATKSAYFLGADRARAHFAEHYELAAAIGMAQQRKSSGRKPGTRARQRDWQQAADALRAQHPGWNKSALAREIAKTHGGSFNTIRQRIR